MRCVFCDLLETKDAVDFQRHPRSVYSFVPLSPVTPGHRLFIPRHHFSDASEAEVQAGKVMEAASEWARLRKMHFNLITSGGEYASQTIFHFHLHYVPRREGDGLLLPWSTQKKENVK